VFSVLLFLVVTFLESFSVFLFSSTFAISSKSVCSATFTSFSTTLVLDDTDGKSSAFATLSSCFCAITMHATITPINNTLSLVKVFPSFINLCSYISTISIPV